MLCDRNLIYVPRSGVRSMLHDREFDLICMIENLIYVAWLGIRYMLRYREFDLCCVIGNSIYVAWSGIRSTLRDRKSDLCWMIGKSVYVAWSENWSVLRDQESDPRCLIENSIHVTRPGVRSTSNRIPTPWHLGTGWLRGCWRSHEPNVPIWTGRLRSHEFQIWTYHRSVRHRDRSDLA